MANTNIETGTTIRSFILSEPVPSPLSPVAETAGTKPATVKRSPAQPVYTVEAVSGADLIVRRHMKTKDTLLVLLPGQNQYYMKEEKTGEIYPLTEEGLTSFLKGIGGTPTDQFGVWNRLIQGKDSAKVIMNATRSDFFREMAKIGAIDLRNYCTITGYSGPGRSMRWYGDVTEYGNDPAPTKETLWLAGEMLKRGATRDGLYDTSWDGDRYGSGDSKAKWSANVATFFKIILHMYGRDKCAKALDIYTADDSLFFGTNGGSVSYVFSKLLMKTAPDNRPLMYTTYGPKEMFQSLHLTEYKDIVANISATRPEWLPMLVAFDADRLLEYVFYDSAECGSADNIGRWLGQWSDTLDMEMEVYGRIVDKYPKDLPLYHDRLAYKSRVIKRTYSARGWAQAVERFSKFGVEGDEYVLLAPATPDDILEEARAMSNCVASYIKRVIDGDTNILFLRKRKDLKRSLCTVEMNNDGEVVQFKGPRNTRPTEEQYAALKGLVIMNMKARGKDPAKDGLGYVLG